MPRVNALKHGASIFKSDDESESHDESGECAGNSCCVFPLILAFMLAALMRQVFRWFRNHYFSGIPPYTVFLIVIGGGFAVAAEALPMLKPYQRCLKVNGKTMMYITLPLLVFQPTYKLEMQTFKRSLNQVLLLAVTGYAIVMVMTAVVVKLLFLGEWNYYTSIIFGIVVCATDPMAVDDAVKVSGVSVDLAALLQGESIIGGAMGMVCFKLFRLLLILSTTKADVYKEEITIFLVQCTFAPMYGVFTAILTVFWVSRIYNDATLEITIVLSVVHLVYYTSELLRLPGMLTVLFFGLYLSSSRSSISHTVESVMKKSFHVLSDIHNSVLHFYAGVFIVIDGLSHISPQVFLNDVLLWLVVNVLRAFMVFFMSPVLRRLGLGMSWEHTLTVWISGLNGSFNIILAMMAAHDLNVINVMSGNDDLDTGNKFFQTAMAVIFLKQALNTSITRFVLRAFGLRAMPKFHQMSLANAMRLLKLTRNQTINALKSDRFMADAAFDIVEGETETESMFKHFRQKRLSVSKLFKRMHVSRATVVPVGSGEGHIPVSTNGPTKEWGDNTPTSTSSPKDSVPTRAKTATKAGVSKDGVPTPPNVSTSINISKDGGLTRTNTHNTNNSSGVPTQTNTPTNTGIAKDGVPPPTNTPTKTSTKDDHPTPSNTPTKTSAKDGVPTPSNTPTKTSTKDDHPTPSSTPTKTSAKDGVPTPSNTPTKTSAKDGVPTPSNTPTKTSAKDGVPTPSNAPTKTSAKDGGPTPANTLTNIGNAKDWIPWISDDSAVDTRENRAESILMLLKAQKKTYWQHFDRGLMSKEALHQLIEWADSAADHKGKYLDVRKVKEACQVRPVLKSLKRQVKLKLRQLQQQKDEARGWLYWQQQVLTVVLSYGFHILDTVAIFLAMAFEIHRFGDYLLHVRFDNGIFIWNCVVVGMYGIIALGELLVMRLRFFKIVWHDITLIIVLMGLVDLMVMSAVGELHELKDHPNYIGRLFIRLVFIVSRAIRLLAMVETVPWVLRKLLKLLEKRISGHLGVGFDICCAYVTGQVEVVRQLDSLVNEAEIRLELRRHCNRHKLDIIRTLGILALENPIIALSVKTRQAMRMVLNAQHDTVKQLKDEGAIQDTDAGLLTKDLEERMKRLLNSPPLVEDDSQDSIIKNMGWVQGDEQLFHFLKEHMEIIHLKPNSIVTEQDNEDFNIYIIGSGVARLERMSGAFNVTVLDYLTAGNILGEINFLTKAVRHKTIRAETAVTVLTLKEDVMEKVLEMNWNNELPPVLYRMWLVIAKRVAIKIIMDDPEYQGMSIERLRMQMYNGYLVDDRLGTSISIHGDPSDTVILVHDEGLYTLVLVIPNEPIELEEFCIQPTRRGSQIDASVLALSASFTCASRVEEICRIPGLVDEDLDETTRKELASLVLESESGSESSLTETNSDDHSISSEYRGNWQPPILQREIIVPTPYGSHTAARNDKRRRSHMPVGATWEISDTWDFSLREDNIKKISSLDKGRGSSESDISSD